MSASGSTPGVFSISMKPNTSASMAVRAASIFVRWRSSSSALSAPRQSWFCVGAQVFAVSMDRK